jgi:hypothetical protein
MNAQYPTLLVIKEGPLAGTTHPLEKDEIIIYGWIFIHACPHSGWTHNVSI